MTLASDGYSATISLTNYGTFYGYFMYAVDWMRTSGTRRTITFTTLSSTTSDTSAGEYFWGNKQASYPVTIIEASDTVSLGTSPAFYLIQQMGSITVSDSKGTDSSKTYSSSATSWWSGSQISTSSLTLAASSSITWTVTVTSDTYGLVLEGTNGTNYLDLNLNYSSSSDAWGKGSSWSMSTYDSSAYGVNGHTYTITVTSDSSGSSFNVTVIDKGVEGTDF